MLLSRVSCYGLQAICRKTPALCLKLSLGIQLEIGHHGRIITYDTQVNARHDSDDHRDSMRTWSGWLSGAQSDRTLSERKMMGQSLTRDRLTGEMIRVG